MSREPDGDFCPKCKRPKARQHDVIRWLSATKQHGNVCFDGMEHSRLMPEEEAIPGAELLKERLAAVRRQRDWLACLAVAGVTK